jgi:hypothetical protein
MKQICLSLLISLMTVTATANDQLILKPKERAPYLGVLVPSATYKAMFAEIEQKDYLQTSLENKILDYSKLEQESQKRELMFFGAGALMGVILGIVVKK